MVTTRAAHWHLQDMGEGPAILLLHGAGASSHSFRAILPRLAAGHRAVALDLPGQGFTQPRGFGRFALPQMADDILALLEAEGIRPVLIVGHSAGAAIALQMVLAGARPRAVLALNGALSPFRGVAGMLFPSMAKMLALGPLTPQLVARSANSARAIAQLIEATGSRIDAEGLAQYRTLVSEPSHVRATLRMMADWALPPLIARFGEIAVPVELHVGEADRAVPMEHTLSVAADLPNARFVTHPGGHLMHEAEPARFAALIAATADAAPRGDNPLVTKIG